MDAGGKGGVFESKNLSLYSYAHQNPIIMLDPDGNEVYTTTIAAPIVGPLGVKASVNFDTDAKEFSHPVIGPALMVGPQFKFMPKVDLGVSTSIKVGDELTSAVSLNVQAGGLAILGASLEANINPNAVNNNNINLNEGAGFEVGPNASISLDYDLDAVGQSITQKGSALIEKIEDPNSWMPNLPTW